MSYPRLPWCRVSYTHTHTHMHTSNPCPCHNPKKEKKKPKPTINNLPHISLRVTTHHPLHPVKQDRALPPNPGLPVPSRGLGLGHRLAVLFAVGNPLLLLLLPPGDLGGAGLGLSLLAVRFGDLLLKVFRLTALVLLAPVPGGVGAELVVAYFLVGAVLAWRGGWGSGARYADAELGAVLAGDLDLLLLSLGLRAGGSGCGGCDSVGGVGFFEKALSGGVDLGC